MKSNTIEERRYSPFILRGPFSRQYQERLDNRDREERGPSMNVDTRSSSVQGGGGRVPATKVSPSSSTSSNGISALSSGVAQASQTSVGVPAQVNGNVPLKTPAPSNNIDVDSDAKSKHTKQRQRELRPMRYGDYVLLSSLIDGGSLTTTGSRIRGLLGADLIIRLGVSLHLFSDDMDLDIFDHMVLQICKPSLQSSSASDADGVAFLDDKTAYGQALTYGGLFMLKLSMNGNYYIGSEVDKSADIEKSCVRLGNFPVASNACQFKLISKYKSRAHEVAYYGDELFISSINANLLLHAGDVNAACGTFDAAPLGCRVLTDANLARLRDTGSGNFLWEFAEYASHSDLPTCGVVSSGSFVRIYQPELQSYLSSRMPQYQLQMFKDETPTCKNGNPLSVFTNDFAVFSFNNRNHGSGKHDFVEDPMMTSIFRIEKTRVLVGGRLKFGDTVRLRHTITGAYVAVSYPESASPESIDSSSSCRIILSRLANPLNITAAKKFLHDTSFIVEAAGLQSGSNLPIGESVRLKHISRTAKHQDQKSAPVITSSPSFFEEYRQNFQRDTNIDIADTDSTNELYLTYSDEVIRFVPSYPCVMAKSAGQNYGSASGEDQVTTSVLENLFSESFQAAKCVRHYSDADVIQFISVDPLDKLYALGGNTIKRTLHDFEGALRVCSERIGAGMMYKFTSDTLERTLRVCEEVIQFCSFVDDLEITTKTKASSDTQSRSLDTEYDMKIRVSRQQFLVMDSGILLRLFWLFRSPYYLGIPRAFIRENKSLSKLFWSITSAICAVCTNNELVQEYVARSSYSGFRTSGTPIGFISHLFSDLRTDEEAAARILQAAVSSNRLLLDALFDEAVMQEVIQMIREKGPKPSLVKLLASLTNAQNNAMIQNQILLMTILYSETPDPRYIYNRKLFLIETALRKPEVAELSKGEYFRSDGELVLLWHGTTMRNRDGTTLDETQSGKLVPRFECVKTLKLTQHLVSDQFVEISERLHSYFEETGDTSDHTWVNLSAIAWTIDPENCFKFDQPGKRIIIYVHNACSLVILLITYYIAGIMSSLAWNSRWRQLERTPSEAAVFLRTQRLVLYYAAVLDLFERATADRRYV